MTIKYISQGAVKTGGFRNETAFARALSECLNADLKEIRKQKNITGILGHLKLLMWFFKEANANINIVPVRGALASIARNLFTKNQTIVVIHSDVQPYSSAFLKWYYRLFLWLKKTFRIKRCKVVVVSEFWKQRMQERGIKDVFIVPNMFDVNFFKQFRTTQKEKKIHLGMPDEKLDKQVYELAVRLTDAGFECYFSTMQKEKVQATSFYNISYFVNYEAYLTEMAKSICTIQMPAIIEGLPRLAHESLLVGTPLIGYKKGGLGDLLEQSNSNIVSNIDEAFEVITQNKFTQINPEFLNEYDVRNMRKYLQLLID